MSIGTLPFYYGPKRSLPYFIVNLKSLGYSVSEHSGFLNPDSALVVQWIEQIRPKDKMGVRFSPRAHITFINACVMTSFATSPLKWNYSFYELPI